MRTAKTYSTGEVADKLGVDRHVIKRMAASGIVKAKMVLGKYEFSKDDIGKCKSVLKERKKKR